MRKQPGIPFLPIPLRSAKSIFHSMAGIGEKVSVLFPDLKANLKNAEIDFDYREYSAIALFSAIFYGILFTIIFILVGVKIQNKLFYALGPVIGLVMGMMVAFYQVHFPKSILTQKTSSIERNLIFALKNMLVQVYAGVPLFDAMVNVSASKFGAVSEELRKAIDEIDSGKQIEDALEDLAFKNPSPYFRRALSQLASGMKSGGRIADILKSIIEYLASEQMLLVRKYGAALNPLAMVYMMLAVIMPTLSVTFMIVLGSFPGMSVSQFNFIVIIFVVTIFQFFYLGVMKSKRPNLIGSS
ncbi:MAG: type II secretion system F family protein [archaeon]